MPADIERVVIYDETVPACEDLMLETRTVITIGDDGFASIEVTEHDGQRPHTVRVGLTPDMLSALRIGWVSK